MKGTGTTGGQRPPEDSLEQAQGQSPEHGSEKFALTRFFDAPRETVFRMMIDPLLIPRWWGPARTRTVVDSMDVRALGEWRFIQYDDEGEEYGTRGVYKQVEFPSRLVYDLEPEGARGEGRTETVTLLDAGDGRTQLTVTAVFATPRARADALAAGMMEDLASSMDRFAELLGEPAETAE